MNRFTTVWRLKDNTPQEQRVLNITKNSIAQDVFAIQQNYAFQVAPMLDEEESLTVIRMVIPKGTPVTKGYSEIRRSLFLLGYSPALICRALGFHEVVNGCS